MKMWNKTLHSLIANLLAGGMLLSANSAFAQIASASLRTSPLSAIYGDPPVTLIESDPLQVRARHPDPDYSPRF
ncbi:hypothetical protein [Paraburkholderia hayleyella]|uniref:hypothetical protein n=1 Tax=Paraburkholderia hayleyella TaxID=2152889 RepID=UPI0012922C05|nr:hypothetical protein [Paraburkholderia hayleyella]